MTVVTKLQLAKRSVRVQTEFDPKRKADRSRTKQHFKDNCNINKIMKKYIKTGMLPMFPGASTMAQYGDFSECNDFQAVQEKLVKAREQFMKLPSEVRKKFENDPKNLIAWIADPNNLDEAVKLGILDKKAVRYPVTDKDGNKDIDKPVVKEETKPPAEA